MPQLINLLIIFVMFVIAAFGLLWLCQKFLPEFPLARWICGGLLIVVALLMLAGQVHVPDFYTPR
jgi:hypothetical protein